MIQWMQNPLCHRRDTNDRPANAEQPPSFQTHSSCIWSRVVWFAHRNSLNAQAHDFCRRQEWCEKRHLPHPTQVQCSRRREQSEASGEGKQPLHITRLPKRSHSLFLITARRIIGFLFGFSLASAFAAYHLLDEYKLASAALQASVQELQTSTEKVRDSGSR